MLKIEKSIFLSKPIIGIVGRYLNGIYKVNESLVNKIIKNGGIPILILPNDNLDEILKLCDGIVMPGGTTIYDYDEYICKYCMENDVPVLGICLGMQVMGSINGTLKNISNHQGTNHKIIIKKDSKLDKILKNNIVNSRHNECIDKTLDYDITAYSIDNVIEAIEHKSNRFNIGVQWHPEDMDDDSLFIELVKFSKETKNKS